jgi:hypothetical protein
MTEASETLETVRISNNPEYLRAVMARAGEAPEVVLEATYMKAVAPVGHQRPLILVLRGGLVHWILTVACRRARGDGGNGPVRRLLLA